MALSPKPSSGFTSLPREVRDMIWVHIASAAGIKVKLCGRHSWKIFDEEFAGCMQTLHEWAPKSSMAKAAFEGILSAAEYRGHWTSEKKIVFDPATPLFMANHYHLNRKMDILSGISFDLRNCVRRIHLDVEISRHLPSYEDKEDQENLVKFERELSRLCQLPRLRRFSLTVWMPSYGDAYYRPMLFFERTSSAIKQLKQRVNGNIYVSISREFLGNRENTSFIDPYNVSWMWDPPSSAKAKHAETETEIVAVEERIKRLITDGLKPTEYLTLLEEFRAAADMLPQDKNDIVEMDDWSVGTGITKEKWLAIRKTWKRRS